MKQLVVWGNYIAITLDGGTTHQLFPMKEVVINIYGSFIKLSHGTDNEFTFQKDEVGGGEWTNFEIGTFTWSTLQDWLVNNTANFKSATGGSVAKSYKANVLLAPVPSINKEYQNDFLELPSAVRYGTGSYALEFVNEIDPTKVRLIPGIGANLGVYFGVSYGPSNITLKFTDFTGNNIDPYTNVEFTIEYWG